MTRVLTVELHELPGQMPDADTDVLIFLKGSAAGELGAYLGQAPDGAPLWVDADGTHVGQYDPPAEVDAWCAFPQRWLSLFPEQA